MQTAANSSVPARLPPLSSHLLSPTGKFMNTASSTVSDGNPASQLVSRILQVNLDKKFVKLYKINFIR